MQFQLDDIQQTAKFNPKKVQRKKNKQKKLFNQRVYFIFKISLIFFALIFVFHNIKIKIKLINDLRDSNKKTKQKLILLDDSIFQFQLNVNTLSQEFSTLGEKKRNLHQQYSNIQKNYEKIEYKINELSLEKIALNKNLSEAIDQYQSLQHKVASQKETHYNDNNENSNNYAYLEECQPDGHYDSNDDFEMCRMFNDDPSLDYRFSKYEENKPHKSTSVYSSDPMFLDFPFDPDDPLFIKDPMHFFYHDFNEFSREPTYNKDFESHKDTDIFSNFNEFNYEEDYYD